MTDLLFLGVGAVSPTTPGNHTALLLRHAGATVLLDAGPAVIVQLHQQGLHEDQITHLYLSHQHGDHTLGSPMLLFRTTPLTVLGAPPVLKAWQQLLDAVYPQYYRLAAPLLELVPLPVDEPHTWPDLPGVTARLAPADHGIPAYGLRLDFAPAAGISLRPHPGSRPWLRTPIC